MVTCRLFEMLVLWLMKYPQEGIDVALYMRYYLHITSPPFLTCDAYGAIHTKSNSIGKVHVVQRYILQ